MAEICLGRAEIERSRLPKVCMVCGGRSSVTRKRSFTQSPPSALLVGGVLLVSRTAKRMKINAPFCHEHRNHWLMRTLIIWLSFGAGFLLEALILFAVAAKSGGHDPNETAMLAALSFGGLMFLAWIVMTVILHQTAIRSTDVTDRSLTLKNVSPSFIEELNDLRKQRHNPTAETARVAKRRPDPDEEEYEAEVDEED